MNQPYILAETDDFAVVFKPPRMHSVPQKEKNGGTLVEWYTESNLRFAQASAEIMHRLDFETHGLVLFAKNEKSCNFFKEAQNNGEFVKEYSAVCKNAIPAEDNTIPGFPPPCFSADQKPLIIESFFRPFGPGRKQVRPVINDGKKHREVAVDKYAEPAVSTSGGGFYRTEIIDISGKVFTVRIKRGFRHQIRCHLCWIGCPIQNDPLYPYPLANEQEPPLGIGSLALRAHALFFPEPSSGKRLEYRIEKLKGSADCG